MTTTNNSIPDFQSLTLPVLQFLSDEKEHPLSEVLQVIAGQFNLSDEDLRKLVPSGQQPIFKNRLTWAISYMKQAGLLRYARRAVYQITPEGLEVLRKKPARIDIALLNTLPGFQEWRNSSDAEDQPVTSSPVVVSTKTPEELIGDTVKDLNRNLGRDLLDLLKSKPANYFERFVLMLLTQMGYGGIEDQDFEVVGKSGDNGIDGIIYQDQFGIDRVYVQAKRWSDNKVQSKDIRDFIGSLSLKGTNKGIFITTSDFTDDAKKTVLMNPQNRIILINGQQLTEYAIKFNVGVQVKMEVEVKTLDNDFFDEA